MAKYVVDDFQTGKEWNTPAKRDLYDMVIPENGGWDCIKKQKDEIFNIRYKNNPDAAKRAWKRWPLRGVREKVSILVGLNKDHNDVKNVQQCIAEQFKTRFDEIYYVCSTSKGGQEPTQLNILNENKTFKTNKIEKLQSLINSLKYANELTDGEKEELVKNWALQNM
jgi:hypothetical protein